MESKEWLKKEGYQFSVAPMTLDNLENILTRYSSELKKENDGLRKNLSHSVSETKFYRNAWEELQTTIEERDKQIEGQNYGLIELSKTIDQIRKQLNYWKELAEAADNYISCFDGAMTTQADEDSLKNIYYELKQKQP